MSVNRIILKSCVTLVVCLGVVQSVHAKLYRWVDENGQVHYSDKLPPSASKRERQVLDDEGRPIETLEAAKTEEEIEEERRQEDARRVEEERQNKQAEKDRILLMTFSTVKELEIARDDRVAQVDAVIAITEAKLAETRKKFNQTKQRVENLEKKGKPVPEDLSKQLETSRQTLLDNEQFVAKKKAERAELIEKFDADIKRFLELKAEEEEREKAEKAK